MLNSSIYCSYLMPNLWDFHHLYFQWTPETLSSQWGLLSPALFLQEKSSQKETSVGLPVISDVESNWQLQNLNESLHHFYLVVCQSSSELSLCHSSLAYPQMFWSHWKVLTSAQCARCPPLLGCRTLGGHMASHQTLCAPAPQQPPPPGWGSTPESVWRPSQGKNYLLCPCVISSLKHYILQYNI